MDGQVSCCNKHPLTAVCVLLALVAGVEALYIWNPSFLGVAPVQTPAHSVVTDLSTVLTVQDTSIGTGDKLTNGDMAVITYTAKLLDGTIVSDHSNAKSAGSFVVGAPATGSGLTLGLLGMQKGGTRVVSIPPTYTFASSTVPEGSVQKNATIIFDLSLIEIHKKR